MTNNDILGAIAKNYENYDLWQHCKNQTIPMNQSEEKWEKPHF